MLVGRDARRGRASSRAPGAVGYLLAGPVAARHRARRHRARARVVGARPRRREPAGSTSCTSAWPTTRRRATCARTATPRTRSATPAATRPTPRSGASPPASASAPDRLDLPITALSGGERRRVELTRILFAGSDLLLLDEPTNHLDIDAKQWLMQFLRSYRGALLVISHDLELLDQAITRVLHLDEGELIEYRGTYSQYLVARARPTRERRTKLAARQTSEIDRLKTLADSMRGQTEKRARTAKTLDHRVEKLAANRVTAARAERKVRVRLPEPPRAGRVALEVADLAKAFGRKTVFEDVTFDVGRGERMLVLGLNGAGKTTLLKTLVGELEADLGTVSLGHEVSLGYYAQEHEGIRARPQRARAHARRERRARPVPPVAARHVRAARRDRVPGREHALGRREDEARAHDARRRPPQPAAARRAHQQPRPAVARRDRRRAAHVEGRDGAREPRHRVRDRARARTGCW